MIKDAVRISAFNSALPRMVFGEGAIVGVCADVSKDGPHMSIAVGNPAVSIRMLESAENR